ncbi:hypothetical protein HMPREF0298_1702 [Corynebacterium lipophiloflavum DSM 44291]|uniref:Uncharacterized protein n=1 Tax=Corynebacterium lipophiloflavum (strain ATCC 700352 / DSM 44291 / CCUG 37336 / JCM 10383 / DMMZ 1944) TaxID=525263 RepID=C0XTD2_CORLD|nr:hypothetical protein HMPREF0298_1702 [Corynebacterium lipophiloflavum DSM 44291]
MLIIMPDALWRVAAMKYWKWSLPSHLPFPYSPCGGVIAHLFLSLKPATPA